MYAATEDELKEWIKIIKWKLVFQKLFKISSTDIIKALSTCVIR